MTVMFCGHSKYSYTENIRQILKKEIALAISEGAIMFYQGGYGAYDRIAASLVWELKKEYPQIESVLVLPYLDKKVDASQYDHTTYPPLENVPRRYAISHRNRWMVDNSDVVIAYVYNSWGGAASTLEYARRLGKRVINLADLQIN